MLTVAFLWATNITGLPSHAWGHCLHFNGEREKCHWKSRGPFWHSLYLKEHWKKAGGGVITKADSLFYMFRLYFTILYYNYYMFLVVEPKTSCILSTTEGTSSTAWFALWNRLSLHTIHSLRLLSYSKMYCNVWLLHCVIFKMKSAVLRHLISLS